MRLSNCFLMTTFRYFVIPFLAVFFLSCGFGKQKNPSGVEKSADDTVVSEVRESEITNEISETFVPNEDPQPAGRDLVALFFEKNANIDPSIIGTGSLYESVQQNFRFETGQPVSAKEFPVLALWGIGWEDSGSTSYEDGIADGFIYLIKKPSETLVLELTEAESGQIFKSELKPSDFEKYTITQYDSYFGNTEDEGSPLIGKSIWRHHPKLFPTHFSSEQEFKARLLDQKGDTVLSGSIIRGTFFSKSNTVLTYPVENPFDYSFGPDKNGTGYLVFLPEQGSCLVLYLTVDDHLFPVAAVLLDYQPTAENPVIIRMSEEFPECSWLIRVVSPDNDWTNDFTRSKDNNQMLGESGYLGDHGL